MSEVRFHSRGLRVQLIQTPTGPISVIRPVAEKLLKEGVISGELDGELHAGDAMTVKAAVMANGGVCDFCSTPAVTDSFDVPDFDMPTKELTGLESTGGWAACETCADLIRRDRRKDLIERSIETAAFPKFSKLAIKELHDRFWKAMDSMVDVTATAKAITDTINGVLDDEQLIDPKQVLKRSTREARIAAVMREVGIDEREVALLIDGKVSSATARKLLEWKLAGKSALLPEFVKTKPMLADMTPHWQRALDMKFAALTELRKKLDESRDLDQREPYGYRGTRLREMVNMGFMDDAKWLAEARAYSFNADTINAIREASKSIPSDTALAEVDFPHTGAGWFYFAEPLPLTASTIASERVHALLWGWETVPAYEVTLPDEVVERLGEAGMKTVHELHTKLMGEGQKPLYTERTIKQLAGILRSAGVDVNQLDRWSKKVDADPALVFSAYVIDEKGQYLKKGTCSPSTRFYWRFRYSIDEMLDANGKSWDARYGPLSGRTSEPYVVDKETTLRTIGELARFFAMACVWFKQTVATTPPQLTQQDGHVERHARKRMMREHKLAEPPTVRVVALRKSARTAASDAPAERRDGAKQYHCRWIVTGHPRRQVCGPGRKDRKLIWIEAHIAGPDDKPLRTRETVYAVVR